MEKDHRGEKTALVAALVEKMAPAAALVAMMTATALQTATRRRWTTARADETAAALVMEAAVQVCLDEDEDFRSRAHRRLYRGRPFSTGSHYGPVLKAL